MVETNPYLLGVTIVVSIIHTIFEILAFKNGKSDFQPIAKYRCFFTENVRHCHVQIFNFGEHENLSKVSLFEVYSSIYSKALSSYCTYLTMKRIQWFESAFVLVF